MSHIRLPEPDQGVIARRLLIIRDLEKLVGADSIVADDDGRRAVFTAIVKGLPWADLEAMVKH